MCSANETIYQQITLWKENVFVGLYFHSEEQYSYTAGNESYLHIKLDIYEDFYFSVLLLNRLTKKHVFKIDFKPNNTNCVKKYSMLPFINEIFVHSLCKKYSTVLLKCKYNLQTHCVVIIIKMCNTASKHSKY